MAEGGDEIRAVNSLHKPRTLTSVRGGSDSVLGLAPSPVGVGMLMAFCWGVRAPGGGGCEYGWSEAPSDGVTGCADTGADTVRAAGRGVVLKVWWYWIGICRFGDRGMGTNCGGGAGHCTCPGGCSAPFSESLAYFCNDCADGSWGGNSLRLACDHAYVAGNVVRLSCDHRSE